MLKELQIDIYNRIDILGEYVGGRTKILVRDKYGEMQVTPSKLLEGIIPTIRSAVDKQVYFEAMLAEKNPKALELAFVTKYKKSSSKITVRDKYGEMEIIPNELLQGYMPSIKSALSPKEYFMNLINDRNPEILKNFSFDEYNSDERITMSGRYGDVSVSSKSLFKGVEPTIRSAKRPQNYLWNMIEDLNPDVFNDFNISREFKSGDYYVYLRNNYGEVKVQWQKIVKGSYPSIVTAINKTEYWVSQAIDIYGDRYDYSKVKYIDGQTKVCVICKEHGEFLVKPTVHTNILQGCPICSSSKGETKIGNFLYKNNIKFLPQYTYENCKSVQILFFDFYLPEYDMLIEYDGEGHFLPIKLWGGEKGLKKRQLRDNIKNQYCKDNNIKLIRIPYWDFDNIEEILTRELNLSTNLSNIATAKETDNVKGL